jgi:hypothetical protein
MAAKNGSTRQDGARTRPGTDPVRRAAGDAVNLRPIGNDMTGRTIAEGTTAPVHLTRWTDPSEYLARYGVTYRRPDGETELAAI